MTATDRASSVIISSDDLPLRTARPVHSGKVRSVYFLSAQDSQRLIEERNYAVAPDSLLAVMVISDRLSAFDCLWRGESLAGVPGKGAALNAIAAHWFDCFEGLGLPPHHLLEMPHPMLWIVRQARPLMIEAIARRYLTGSLWRAYERGDTELAGVSLAPGLARYSRLSELLFTPSTKGVVRGIPELAEADDAPVAPGTIRRFASTFGLRDATDLDTCEHALNAGFECIEGELAARGDLLVDTKFEFGLAPSIEGGEELIYMDEVGTPDSSRIWRRADWEAGDPREHSKEQFREALMHWVPDKGVLLDPSRMCEREELAASSRVPDEMFMQLSATYTAQAERITGRPLPAIQRPREAMLDLLNDDFALLR